MFCQIVKSLTQDTNWWESCEDKLILSLRKKIMSKCLLLEFCQQESCQCHYFSSKCFSVIIKLGRVFWIAKCSSASCRSILILILVLILVAEAF